MAVTTEKSTQVTNENNGVANESVNYKGLVHFFQFDFTQGAAAGDINSTMDLIKLPPGKWRFLKKQSIVYVSAFGAARTLDIGHTGYTEPDDDVVAADEIAIHSAADASAAGSFEPGDELEGAGEDGSLIINTRTTVVIQAKVEGGTIPAGATIKGRLAFMY